MTESETATDDTERALVGTSPFQSNVIAGWLFIGSGLVIALLDTIVPAFLLSAVPAPAFVPLVAVVFSIILGIGLVHSRREPAHRWRRAGLVAAMLGTGAASAYVLQIGVVAGGAFVVFALAAGASLWARKRRAISIAAVIAFCFAAAPAFLTVALHAMGAAPTDGEVGEVLSGELIDDAAGYRVQVPARRWRLFVPTGYEDTYEAQQRTFVDPLRNARMTISVQGYESAFAALVVVELYGASHAAGLDHGQVYALELVEAGTYDMAESRLGGLSAIGWVDGLIFAINADGQLAVITCSAAQRWRRSVMDDCRALAMSYRRIE
ncbi:MAG: hypothetical protein ACI81R_002167 [Bradymonadia bacterium]|jgi:hypothetical protein